MITNTEGTVTEHIEYTPYGELWIEQRLDAGAAKTPFRFTGKELDGETGLYYYGARYLNPKTSLWLSTDPAMGEYIPQAPVNDEVRERNGNLPGMGGVYNYVNLHLYHYAGNNPVKYTDPDGKKIFDARWWMRNADNLLSGVLSVSEVVAGLATTAATGISGVGVIIGGIMVYHGVANASTQLTKILITTIAAELRGDDYADYLDTFMPDTAIGLFFGSLAVIAGIVMNSPDNQSVEKAGAIGDLVDIGVGLLLSLSNSSFVSQSEKYLKSSGSLMNKADLLKLQQFIADAKRLPALKAVQGTVENLDRLKSYIDNMIQILD
jgi:RHS repeat-associated protein